MSHEPGVDGPRDGEFSYFHRVLTKTSVPPSDAPLPAFLEFALSFDAYAYFGDTNVVAESANNALTHWDETGELPTDLVTLRTCLFFEQRRMHHTDGMPGRYFWLLIDAVRDEAPDPGDASA